MNSNGLIVWFLPVAEVQGFSFHFSETRNTLLSLQLQKVIWETRETLGMKALLNLKLFHKHRCCCPQLYSYYFEKENVFKFKHKLFSGIFVFYNVNMKLPQRDKRKRVILITGRWFLKRQRLCFQHTIIPCRNLINVKHVFNLHGIIACLKIRLRSKSFLKGILP